MFDFIHGNKRIVQIILALIMLPFAFFGVDSYLRQTGESDAVVARVGSQTINRQEFAEALQQQQERLRSALGAQASQVTDSPEFRRTVLQDLVQQQLLLNQAQEAHFTVPDAQLAQAISGIEAFQQDGKFSQARFETLLRNRGMTPLGFENKLRQELLIEQVGEAIGETAIEPKSLTQRLLEMSREQREVSQAVISAENFLGEVKLEPNAAREYYDGHQKTFETPEQVRVQYVVLSADSLVPQIEVTEEEVRKQYQATAQQYEQKEERQASHILISVPKEADAAAKTAARERAEELASEATKNPDSFAELARKHSQDPGSAAQGGDLGSFARGVMTKPFEDAVFSMKVGEVRGPVESEFGYHIIKLTAVKEPAARSFEQVKDQIRQDLKKQKAQRKFAEIAENFSNTVFEQSDTLKPAAEAFKLDLQESGWFGRAGGETPPLKNDKLTKAIFSDDVIKDGRNTEAVEVAPSTLVAARVLEHKPASLRSFEDVKSEITAQLVLAKAAELARKRGEEKLQALLKGEDAGLKWSEPELVSRSDPKKLEPAAVQQVFRTAVSNLPAYTGVETNKGYRLLKISRVVQPEKMEERERAAFAQQLQNLRGQVEFRAFLASLRDNTEVKIREGALETR